MPATKPYADTRLPAYIEKRILELRPIKSQAEIATETGFPNPNMISMLKSGAIRVPLDRVPALAEALQVDPARLLQLALEQWAGSAAARAFDRIFETVVSKNEVGWLSEIRDASDHTDPVMTTRARAAIRAIFGK
ncbi:helix-turn-helix domain-containing protein [Devosia sp. XJ19-1]|uniref:Helix-turn-helix domain-containing protein n=1 Tax=Devosia ureilytica TaxID=2952754 RepID=A0A9Q4AQA2_9HYPH|nr:helix-turn-helix transcriptional regulator [Devosia ureilytica]MCP8884502.1 helix-turn-helix domain-containing protein [Devosia ureilytica]MCP8888132.1 helix-turn-helix domain-containing protein [Devosia ureilytica]